MNPKRLLRVNVDKTLLDKIEKELTENGLHKLDAITLIVRKKLTGRTYREIVYKDLMHFKLNIDVARNLFLTGMQILKDNSLDPEVLEFASHYNTRYAYIYKRN